MKDRSLRSLCPNSDRFLKEPKFAIWLTLIFTIWLIVNLQFGSIVFLPFGSNSRQPIYFEIWLITKCSRLTLAKPNQMYSFNNMFNWRPSELTITNIGSLPYFQVSWQDPVTHNTLFCSRKIRRKRSLLEMESTDIRDVFELVAVPDMLKQSCGMWQAKHGERPGWQVIWVQGPSPWLAEPIARHWLHVATGPNIEKGVIEIILDYYDPRRQGDLYEHTYRFMICGCRFCCEPKVHAAKRHRRNDPPTRNRILWAR